MTSIGGIDELDALITYVLNHLRGLASYMGVKMC